MFHDMKTVSTVFIIDTDEVRGSKIIMLFLPSRDMQTNIKLLPERLVIQRFIYYRYYLRPSRFTKLGEKNVLVIMGTKNPEFMGYLESKFSKFADISSYWAKRNSSRGKITTAESQPTYSRNPLTEWKRKTKHGTNQHEK